jgi:hypothetical protein
MYLFKQGKEVLLVSNRYTLLTLVIQYFQKQIKSEQMCTRRDIGSGIRNDIVSILKMSSPIFIAETWAKSPKNPSSILHNTIRTRYVQHVIVKSQVVRAVYLQNDHFPMHILRRLIISLSLYNQMQSHSNTNPLMVSNVVFLTSVWTIDQNKTVRRQRRFHWKLIPNYRSFSSTMVFMWKEDTGIQNKYPDTLEVLSM